MKKIIILCFFPFLNTPFPRLSSIYFEFHKECTSKYILIGNHKKKVFLKKKRERALKVANQRKKEFFIEFTKNQNFWWNTHWDCWNVYSPFIGSEKENMLGQSGEGVGNSLRARCRKQVSGGRLGSHKCTIIKQSPQSLSPRSSLNDFSKL